MQGQHDMNSGPTEMTKNSTSKQSVLKYSTQRKERYTNNYIIDQHQQQNPSSKLELFNSSQNHNNINQHLKQNHNQQSQSLGEHLNSRSHGQKQQEQSQQNQQNNRLLMQLENQNAATMAQSDQQLQNYLSQSSKKQVNNKRRRILDANGFQVNLNNSNEMDQQQIGGATENEQQKSQSNQRQPIVLSANMIDTSDSVGGDGRRKVVIKKARNGQSSDAESYILPNNNSKRPPKQKDSLQSVLSFDSPDKRGFLTSGKLVALQSNDESGKDQLVQSSDPKTSILQSPTVQQQNQQPFMLDDQKQQPVKTAREVIKLKDVALRSSSSTNVNKPGVAQSLDSGNMISVMGKPPIPGVLNGAISAQKGALSTRNITLQQKMQQSIAVCRVQGRKMGLEGHSTSRQQTNSRSSSRHFTDQNSNLDHSSHKKSNNSNSKKGIPKSAAKSQRTLIAIKIVDADKKVIKTFIAKKEIIVNQMKYFSKHLNAAAAINAQAASTATTTLAQDKNQPEVSQILDIQVCCDAAIFKFLLDYCTELHEEGAIKKDSTTKLTGKLLFPVLVSSVFLQIDKLIKDCITYWKKNFESVIQEQPIPVTQLEVGISNKLCQAVDMNSLLKFEKQIQTMSETTDSIYAAKILKQKSVLTLNQDMLQRMFTYHTFQLLNDESFMTCQFCSEIYPVAHATKLKCSATHDFFVDNSENRIQMHVANQQLDLERFCEYLHLEEQISWKVIFAMVLARTIILPRCQVCLDKTPAAFLQSCNSHNNEPCFNGGAHIGVYPCCGQHVIRAAYEQHLEEVQRLRKFQAQCKVKKQRDADDDFEMNKMISSQHNKPCTQPLGCHVQDHSIDWLKISKEDKDLLEFLKLGQIAPYVFEKKSVAKQESCSSKKGSKQQQISLAALIQQYQQDMIGVIKNAYGRDGQIQVEIPPGLNNEMTEDLSPTAQAKRQQRMLQYAFSGIMEQFEDDFDSDDSEFLYHSLERKGLKDESFSRIGLSTQTSTSIGVAKLRNQLPENATKEQILLASWNVLPETKKKVRKTGRDIVYSFKFNLETKQQEAPKFFTKLRDDRLKAMMEQDKNCQAESLLAIPSSKELFVKKKDYSEFSKNHIKCEQTLQQKAFDSKRIEQMIASMSSQRQKEGSSQSQKQLVEEINPIKAQKQQKSERDIAVQQRNTVNRLAVNKDQQSTNLRFPKPNNIYESFNSSRVKQEPNSQQQSVDQSSLQPVSPTLNTSSITFLQTNQVTTAAKRRDMHLSLRNSVVPITVQSYAYMSPQNVSAQTHHITVPTQFQQKVISPSMFVQAQSASMQPSSAAGLQMQNGSGSHTMNSGNTQNTTNMSKDNNNTSMLPAQRITKAVHVQNQPSRLQVATAHANAVRNVNKLHQSVAVDSKSNAICPLSADGQSRSFRNSQQVAESQAIMLQSSANMTQKQQAPQQQKVSSRVSIPLHDVGSRNNRQQVTLQGELSTLTSPANGQQYMTGSSSKEYEQRQNAMKPARITIDNRLSLDRPQTMHTGNAGHSQTVASSPNKQNRQILQISCATERKVGVRLVGPGTSNQNTNFFQSDVMQQAQQKSLNQLSQSKIMNRAVQLKQPPQSSLGFGGKNGGIVTLPASAFYQKPKNKPDNTYL